MNFAVPLFLFWSVIILFGRQLPALAYIHHYDFVVKETNVTKLCVEKSILTVNDSFPGPEIRVRKGDTAYVNVHNQGHYGITLHWHGVKQPSNPWSDGPEYITQCPIEPGANFTYQVIFTDEEGTLWWHAHSDWTRATVHGAIIILPKEGTTAPYPEPDGEEVIVLAAWYKGDLMTELIQDIVTGSDLPHSSGYTTNGELGDFSNCSSETIYRWSVDYGSTYLLRIVNAVVNAELFFAIANHTLTVVGMDGAYVKPIVTDYILISPGQTMNVLLTADQPLGRYYMAARQYSTEPIADTGFDHSNATAILEYNGDYNLSASPTFPHSLPLYLDMKAGKNFTHRIRSLANEDHPISVPTNISTRMFITISMNLLCKNITSCNSSDADHMIATSMNNVSWKNPQVDVLETYYRNLSGYYTSDFPDWPATMFNFTADYYDEDAVVTQTGTKVKVLNYNESVEIVFQGTGLLGGSVNHPMHLHGHSFYIVGIGYGNFDNETDPLSYNLVDPPEVNTFGVPKDGWLTIRFVAKNPGVWFWHCHLDRHMTWGMDTAFIVKDGGTEETSLRPPPPNMPQCTGVIGVSVQNPGDDGRDDALTNSS
ncbi:hypothetical protein SAY87_028495 [Trapa incisa]|uniref:Laccase n=1 Tax=Trapa incisa TaxID=236973 RepID=A0AAN7QQ45_9MYRT|nr:hypothetical protein SAY87_028495 [Trapa incisa]